MSLVSSGTSTGRAEVEDRRRSSDWVVTIFGIGARAAECRLNAACPQCAMSLLYELEPILHQNGRSRENPFANRLDAK